MTLASFTCLSCGDVVADVDRTGGESVLRLATGLTFGADGRAVCPGCGCDTKITFSALESLIPATVAP